MPQFVFFFNPISVNCNYLQPSVTGGKGMELRFERVELQVCNTSCLLARYILCNIACKETMLAVFDST